MKLTDKTEKAFGMEQLRDKIEQKHTKEEMKKAYNHGALSLLDTGHGDSFNEYYKQTYNKQN